MSCSFLDLNSIMQEAENQALAMATYIPEDNPQESTNNLEESTNNLEESTNNPQESTNNPEESTNNPEESTNNPEESDEIPMLEQVDINSTSRFETPLSSEQIREAMSHADIPTLVDRALSDPNALQDSLKYITPEAMDQARKLAMGNHGKAIQKEMKKRGINPRAMKKQLMDSKKALRAPGLNLATLNFIIITQTRKLKSRKIAPSNLSLNVASIIHATEPIEISCSRLANGPLSGKCIKAWYDPHHPPNNRRATKLLGFPVGGDILIGIKDENLDEKDFLAAEKYLS